MNKICILIFLGCEALSTPKNEFKKLPTVYSRYSSRYLPTPKTYLHKLRGQTNGPQQ